MNCQICRVEIEELETNERLSDEARAHLSVCHVCRAFHDERQSLKKLVGSLGTVSAPPDFDFRLRARLAAAKGAGNNRFSWRSFAASAPAIGLAASFALIVAAVVFYNQTKSGPPAANTPPNEIARQTPEQKSDTGKAASDFNQTDSEAPREAAAPMMEDENPPTIVRMNKPRPRTTGNGKLNPHRDSTTTTANASQGGSTDFGRRPAPVITPDVVSPLATTGANPLVEVPVRSASQTMRVFVDDRSGAKRTVTLEPVIFGSQDFTGRNDSRIATSQGIW